MSQDTRTEDECNCHISAPKADCPVHPRPPSIEELTAKVRAAAEAGTIAYDCCFCHEGVPAKEVSAIGVITRWAHPENEQAYQQWWCHLSCFERITGETFEAEPSMENDDE